MFRNSIHRQYYFPLNPWSNARQRAGTTLAILATLMLSTMLVCPSAGVRAAPADAAEIERLIKQLGSDMFREREAASRRLDAIGEPAWDALGKAAETSHDAEIRRRAERLVRAIGIRMFTHLRRIPWQHMVQHTVPWPGKNSKKPMTFRVQIPVHIYHTAFSPDSRSYLAGGDIGPLRLWDVATGRQLQEFRGHDGWTCQAVFTPDGKRVLSGGIQDKCVRLWDVATGKQIGVFAGHTQEVASVAVSPDGRWALSGSADKTLRLWNLATGKEIRRLEGHTDRCGGVFSPDGKHVLSYSADRSLRLWDVEKGKPVRILEGHTNHVCGVFFLPCGRQILSYAMDNTLRVWDIASGKEIRRLSLGADHCMIRWLALTPDGRRFLTNHQDCTVRLHDLASGRELHRFLVPPGISPQGLSISPDGRHAADGSFRGCVDLFRLKEVVRM
jgi:WD40 repeat protein